MTALLAQATLDSDPGAIYGIAFMVAALAVMSLCMALSTPRGRR